MGWFDASPWVLISSEDGFVLSCSCAGGGGTWEVVVFLCVFVGCGACKKA